jgi:DNA-binding HxlR family transcriptional regulator
MKPGKNKDIHHGVDCRRAMAAVKDALYVLNGKWKLPLIVALSEGPLRFKELQRKTEGITPKILSKELKELELNEFVNRTVYATSPVTVEYELTPYSKTLDRVLIELQAWGEKHRQYIFSKSRKNKREKEFA